MPEAQLLRIEVSKGALQHNVGVFQDLLPDKKIIGVLKSNAYGHGLALVGRALDQDERVVAYAVDSLVEARDLRASGIKKPILLIGYVPRAALAAVKKMSDVTLMVTSLEQAKDLVRLVDFPLDVHVKVNTGMHRQGVEIDQLQETFEVLDTNSSICVTGLASHLADADGEEETATRAQLDRWKEAVEIAARIHANLDLHIGATAGTYFVNDAPSTHVRVGIGLYGYDMIPDRRLDLRPALSLFAKLTNVRTIPAGEAYGYNGTYVAKEDTRLAIVPAGYQEGLWRAASSKGVMRLKGAVCPIVGRVSMNLTAIDIVDVPEASLEDEVEVISSDPKAPNSIENIAKTCGNIGHDTFVGLDGGIRRILVP